MSCYSRHYLLGRKFEVLTDHKPLEWLAGQKSIGRRAVIIQEYDFTVKYRRGDDNENADALSRLIFPEPENTEAHTIVEDGDKTQRSVN